MNETDDRRYEKRKFMLIMEICDTDNGNALHVIIIKFSSSQLIF
jgi:hypothetical protein